MIVLHATGFALARTSMRGETPSTKPRKHERLHWQSQAVLLLLVPPTAVWVTLAAGQAWNQSDPVLWQALGVGAGLAILVYLTHAATAGAALTGGIFAAALTLQTPGRQTALWPLLGLLVLTFSATRFGRRRKEKLGTAESRRGRRASQVAANLGVAALAGIPLSSLHVFSPQTFRRDAALVAMIAAMSEATADTVSSELGQVLGGEPRLITTFQRVPAGTDGGISVAGTGLGCLGAAVIVGVGALTLGLDRREAMAAFVSGIAGLFVDSMLGAVPERRGWLNNDAVNTLSTLAAALLAAWMMR